MELEQVTKDIKFEEIEISSEDIAEKAPIDSRDESEDSESRTTIESSSKNLNPDSKFYGTIKTSIKDENGKSKRIKSTDLWTVQSNDGKTMQVSNAKGEVYKTNPKTVEFGNLQKKLEKQREEAEKRKLMFSFNSLEPDQQLERLVNAGIINIWMVGPAGCGKTTMGTDLSKKLNRPCFIQSCGIGTSAAEFIGYKYPTREATEFSKYYSQPSVIIIDEFTALDPAVAQIVNSALANGYIQTTTGQVFRHPECIIIATSNTFGTGASRQYVANNQLDASTIDRFVGGIIEVDYSSKYESQFDSEVVAYVNKIRNIIKHHDIRRVASTRMIITGCKLKNAHMSDWKDLLIVNWTKAEKELIKQFLESEDIKGVKFSKN